MAIVCSLTRKAMWRNILINLNIVRLLKGRVRRSRRDGAKLHIHYQETKKYAKTVAALAEDFHRPQIDKIILIIVLQTIRSYNNSHRCHILTAKKLSKRFDSSYNWILTLHFPLSRRKNRFWHSKYQTLILYYLWMYIARYIREVCGKTLEWRDWIEWMGPGHPNLLSSAQEGKGAAADKDSRYAYRAPVEACP